MFEKYARAVSDKTERENLHKLYRLRNIVFACFMVVCFAIIIEALVAGDEMSTGQLVCFLLTLLCWIVLGILSIVMFVRFRRKYNEILTRPQEGGESDDVAAYRKQAAQEQKSTRWALWVMIACIVAMFVLIVVDTVKYDDDKLHGFAYAGIAVAVVGVLLYFFVLMRANLQKAAQSEKEGAPDVQNIDAAQGRPTKYRLQDDKNLQSYKYILPTPELRARAEILRKKSGKASMIAIAIAVAVSFAAVLALFSPWGICPDYRGYAFVLFMGVLLIATFVSAALPYTRKLLKVDKAQKKELEENPAYAKNLAIYKAYEQHGKIKGKVLYFCLGLTFVIALALAIAFPDKLWSVASAVVVVVGLYLNNFFVMQLRQKVMPLEKEIDAALAAEQEKETQSNTPQSDEND